MIIKFFILFAFLFIFLYPLPYTLNPILAQQATLSLSPSTGTFNKDCAFSLGIVLDTGGAQTDGTDAILIYDSARVSATSVTKGTIYEDYPGTNVDDATGKVVVSGLASVTSPFSGKGTLATVNFTVKSNATVGATQIKFDFDPNDRAKTTDSNVVQRGTVVDVLSSVVNGNYTIGTGSCVSPSPSPARGGVGAPAVSTPGAVVKPPPKTIDQAVGGEPGTPQVTYTLAIVGVLLTILGILGLALL